MKHLDNDGWYDFFNRWYGFDNEYAKNLGVEKIVDILQQNLDHRGVDGAVCNCCGSKYEHAFWYEFNGIDLSLTKRALDAFIPNPYTTSEEAFPYQWKEALKRERNMVYTQVFIPDMKDVNGGIWLTLGHE